MIFRRIVPTWSARTCPRFGTTRPVLRSRTAEGGHVASWESGDTSPHSKFRAPPFSPDIFPGRLYISRMARPPLILVSPSIEKRGVEFHDLSVSLSVKY